MKWFGAYASTAFWKVTTGHPPADIPAIEDLLLRVSRLVEGIPEISELDLNPVFALLPGKGCRIMDARIRIGRTEIPV